LKVVRPVDALWPIPRAPELVLRKPEPVLEPGGRGFWMKLTTKGGVSSGTLYGGKLLDG
jgi:hypothetical protein